MPDPTPLRTVLGDAIDNIQNPPGSGAETESPIEELFALAIAPHLRPGTQLAQQVWLVTPAGRFRADFILTTVSGRRLMIECDGAAFHIPGQDLDRDAAIRKAGLVDDQFRFRGTDIVSRMPQILETLAYWYAELFTDRSLAVIKRIDEVRLAEKPPKRPDWNA